MQNNRRFSLTFTSMSRFALAAIVISASFAVAGCGSKKDEAATAPAAATDPTKPVHTPSEQEAIKKQAADDKVN